MFKILVAEDDAELQQLFCRVLTRSGFTAVGVPDGAAALEILEKEYIDLIVSDIMMPRMDGYTLVRSLRDAGNTIPILMITAKDSFQDMQFGFLAGADDYLVKPINVNELVLRIQALLRRAQMVADRRQSIGSTVFEFDSFTVRTGSSQLVLPQKEFLLLYKLVSSPAISSRASSSWTTSGAWIPRRTRARWTCTSTGCATTSARTRISRSRRSAASDTRR